MVSRGDFSAAGTGPLVRTERMMQPTTEVLEENLLQHAPEGSTEPRNETNGNSLFCLNKTDILHL